MTKFRNVIFAASSMFLALTTPVMAWSWTDDAAGEKMDKEARHFLTTQNLCGVQLKASYLRDLDSRIVNHFTTMADDYRKYLLGSVLNANAEYIGDANPVDVKRECEKRFNAAMKAGVADPQTKPYSWGTQAEAASASPPAPANRNGFPLKDGLYAQDVTKAYCVNRDKGYAVSELFYVKISKSGKMLEIYESTCSIKNIKRNNNQVDFKCVGQSEGEATSRNIQFNLVTEDSFSFGGKAYKKCN